jgi:anaerobic selenocysteine-containing dehydrogenase
MKNGRKGICPFCCLQDGLRVEGGEFAPIFGENSLLHLNYDLDDRVNEGSLCSRGNSVIELLQHSQRLIAPYFQGKEIDWTEVHKVMTAKLGKGTSILLGPNLTLEEAWLARELSSSLGLDAVAHLAPDDGEAFQVLRWLGVLGGRFWFWGVGLGGGGRRWKR